MKLQVLTPLLAGHRLSDGGILRGFEPHPPERADIPTS